MKIRITNNGTTQGTKFIDTKTGNPIDIPVRGVRWEARVEPRGSDDLATAVLEIDYVECEGEGECKFETMNPATGKYEVLAALIFADGTRYDFNT